MTALMGAIEDIYADLDAEVSEEEFREAVEAKVEQMGGLADEETAAMLVAHELGDDGVEGIADVEAGMDEVKFLAKVVSVGEIRTFERDGEDEDGHVLNIEVADETGRVRVALWDDAAVNGAEELDPGDVLRIKGRPKEGYNGLEVSASRVEGDQDASIDVDLGEEGTIEGLSLGQNDVNVRGRVLGVEPVRTFDRDDGSEGKVANLVLGDETGRVRVTLWDEQADTVEEVSEGVSVEVVDGYVRERDGDLELHVGNRGAIEELDEDIEYVPETTDIAAAEIGQTVDIKGGVIETDPKRTFDRDDGSEGQVRNIRVKDDTDDIRVALWGDKADLDVELADYVVVTDVEIQDGWQDDKEASAGWRSTVAVTDQPADAGDPVRLDKQRYRVPRREELPDLDRYAKLIMGDGEERVVAYTEATRGCKHLCRHCPVVPVYQGRFFAVPREVVMEDVRAQIAQGAQHVTFGDPDFLNGPGHAFKLAEQFHQEFPEITYDATIKVEHLKAHADKLDDLRRTGCLFVTTAVEEVDDAVLDKLEKGHTRQDFVEVVQAARDAGLTLSPTFIPFHPWSTPEGFLDLLRTLAELDLVENVGPIQLSIRLLIPQGSRILELDGTHRWMDGFDPEKLTYRWSAIDPRADALQERVRDAVQQGDRQGLSRRARPGSPRAGRPGCRSTAGCPRPRSRRPFRHSVHTVSSPP